MADAAHWREVYATRGAHTVSWYRSHLERSTQLIVEVAPSLDARIVDVGGGASTLVDDLLDAGYRDLTVLDVAEPALDLARARLGERAAEVTWIAGDATEVVLPPASVDLWHDRAVLHFLLGEARDTYVARARDAVRSGGHVIAATFALDGPERCSGLSVTRYDADGLATLFGDAFEAVSAAREVHTTPAGREQAFTYVVLERR